MQDNALGLKYQDWHRSVLQMWLESSNQHQGVISTYIEQQRYTPHEASPILWSGPRQQTWSPGLSHGPATGICQWRTKLQALRYDGGMVEARHHNPLQFGGHDQG